MLTCPIFESDRIITFAITDISQDNTKLLEQLKSRFKRKINWNKNQSKVLSADTISVLRVIDWSNFSRK